MRGRRAFGALAFLGSFLLFHLEVLSGKLLLPRFGAAAYVWTTCMMLFQGLLLAGYLYCRWVLRRFGPRRYARWHLLVLAIPLFFFPLAVPETAPLAHPALHLLEILLLSISVPFLALATTTPVVQSWLALRGGEEAEGSYALYAASNAGALAALLSFPLALEPFFTLSQQLRAWEALYVAWLVLHLACLPASPDTAEALLSAAPPAPEPRRPSLSERLLWFLLALGPSAFMLAATNLLMLDLAAVPLLWVVPLAVYLLTFILNFKRRPWYPERLSVVLAVAMLLWLGLAVATVLFAPDFYGRWNAFRRMWVVNKLVFVNASLFILAMVCHRALAQSKPEAARSADFYSWIGAGGWGGGILIGVALPAVGRHLAMPELDWALAAALSIAGLLWRDRRRGRLNWEGRWPALAAFALLLAGGTAFYVRGSPFLKGRTVVSLRNFYGYRTVLDDGDVRRFYHGNTMHGVQYRDSERRDEPLLYYHRGAPIGEIFERFGPSFKSVGVVGLGVGALAAYGRPGQAFDFYELDPDIAELARRRFTFLADSRARSRVIVGDGRLSLESAGEARYDLLVLDAFSGGAIPVHLLTREAALLYLSRLNDGGLLVYHVSNRLLNLRPVLAALARDLRLAGAAKVNDPRKRLGGERFYSSWVALARDRSRLKPLLASGWTDLRDVKPASRPWTDQYANLWSALGN